MNLEATSFTKAYPLLKARMARDGKEVKTEAWQGIDVSNRPDMVTFELLNMRFHLALFGLESLNHWRGDIRPNLPWADDHFCERVSGEPLNPPPSWAWWPWAGSADKFRADEQFNHTYPERYWPKYAGITTQGRLEDGPSTLMVPHKGIRWTYGDLDDVVELLRQQPHTRQAYLPMFFPEDTGIGDGGRKPCTLGYQFIMRENRLHCFYPMRSCDLIRHFPDDVYLTVRLIIWVLEQLRHKNEQWKQVRPGTLTMHMTSLHCFTNDMLTLRREHEAH